MDWNALFRIVVTLVMVVVGVGLIPVHPLAAASLLVYGALVGIELLGPAEEIVDEHEVQLAVLRIVLLLIAVVDILLL